MPAQAVQAIIGNALIDDDFCKALLNGSRGRVLQSFDLSGEEVEAIMAIRADSLEQFAGELHQWLLHSQGQFEIKPLPMLRPSRVRKSSPTT